MFSRYAQLLASFALFALSLSVCFGETLRVNGSRTVASLLVLPYEEQLAREADAELYIVPNGSGDGLLDLIQGRSHIAILSAPLDEVFAEMTQKYPQFASASIEQLAALPLGTARVAVVANFQTPLDGLTQAQLRSLFAGDVRNFNSVGGPDLPVHPIALPHGDGVRTTVQKLVLKNRPYALDLIVQPDPRSVLRLTQDLPGAIAIVPSTSVTPSVKNLPVQPPIAQQLFVVSRNNPSASEERFIQALQVLANRTLTPQPTTP